MSPATGPIATRRRLGAVVLAAGLLAMTLGGWRLRAAPFPAASRGAPGSVTAAVGPAQAGTAQAGTAQAGTAGRSHAWYCAGATAVKGGQADGTLVLANSGSAPLRGTVTVYGNESGGHGPAPATRPVDIGPHGRGQLRLGDILAAPFVAATVVFDGPGGSVDLQVAGSLGEGAVGCATGPSPRWYVAAGQTKDGASDLLALFNPFPEDALADLSFADDQGSVAPGGFQGIFVPGHSLVMVDVGAHLVQQTAVAATVGVRVGRLVASQVQLDAIPGQVGLSVVTAAPAPASRWWLPDGLVGPGLTEQVHVYDPTDAPADVTVAPRLARGAAVPFHLRLAPHSAQVVDLSHQTRIPAGDDFATTVSSRGAPVVVERTVVQAGASRGTGSAEMLGAALSARRWQVTAGGTGKDRDEWLVVLDPGNRPATLAVSYLDQGVERPVPGLGQVVVAPGSHSYLRIGDHLQVAGLTLMVGSDEPVVVERDLYVVGGPGVSLAIPSTVS